MLTDDEASFNLELDTSGPGPLVRVHGDLDLETAPELTGLLKTLLGPHPVVVDLTDVEFMDSSGLGVLVGAHKESIAHSGALVVVGPQPRIQKILRITKLDKVFTVYPTLDDFSAVLAEQQLAGAADNIAASPAAQPPGQAQTPASPQVPGEALVPETPGTPGAPHAQATPQDTGFPHPPGQSQAPGSPQVPDAAPPQVPTSSQGPGGSSPQVASQMPASPYDAGSVQPLASAAGSPQVSASPQTPTATHEPGGSRAQAAPQAPTSLYDPGSPQEPVGSSPQVASHSPASSYDAGSVGPVASVPGSPPAAMSSRESGLSHSPGATRAPASSQESGLSYSSDEPQATASGGDGSSVLGSSRDGGPPGRDGGRG